MKGGEPGEGSRPGAVTIGYRGRVRPDWIDINGHMNVTCYDRVFDAAESAFFETLGIGEPYIRRTGFSIFRLERLLVYEHELLAEAPVEVRSRLLWSDRRRLHHFHELWNTGAGFRAAVADVVSIHFDLGRRRAAEVPPEVAGPLMALLAAQGDCPPPRGAVQRINGRRCP